MRRRRNSFERGGGRKRRDGGSAEVTVESLDSKGIEMVDSLSLEAVESLNEEYGLRLTEDGRIDPDWFKETGYYSEEEVQEHNAYVTDREGRFARDAEHQSAFQNESKKISDLSEKIIFAIFGKTSRADGLVLFRTAAFDDIRHQTDFEVVLKETGQVLFSFDATLGQGTSKIDRIRSRNERGAHVKYAPVLGEDGLFHPSSIDGKKGNPPLVHLRMSRKKVSEFVNSIGKGHFDVEDYCDSFFDSLICSMYNSFDTIKANIPEQEDSINEVSSVIQKETKIDPGLCDLVES